MLLEQAIEEFITARRADGRSPRTIKDYHRVLDPFTAWCRKQGTVQLADLDVTTVRSYVVHLREKGWAENTVGIHVRNLRAFLRWLYEENYTETNLALAIRPSKARVRPGNLPTKEEVCRLIAVCNSDQWASRDKAMILLLLDTGVRLGEMASLRREDVHIEDDPAWLQVYVPKTNNVHFAFLCEETAVALGEYLAQRGEDGEEALWVGQRGALTGQGIYKAIRRRAARAGLNPRKFRPHNFRKLFATLWVDNGGDIVNLQRLGGWNSLEMLETVSYTHLTLPTKA